VIVPVEHGFDIGLARRHGSGGGLGHSCGNEAFEIREKSEIVGQLQQLTGPGHSWMLTGTCGTICITTLQLVAETDDRLIFGFSSSRNANSKLLTDPACSVLASIGAWRFGFRTRIFDSIFGGPVTGLVARLPLVLGVVPALR